jgi:predicted regulator of Ras-like GTPase activity (Roadblock/LC7/MglB family)
MAPLSDQPKGPGDGFEGVIQGLGLSDVVQFNSQNHFTGCLSFHSGESTGLVFFLTGEVVHVEHGVKSGEEALCDILEWPNGQFRLHPGLTSSRTTIRKPCQHLLLDVSRTLDERRAGHITQHLPPSPKDQVDKALKVSEIIEKVRAVPGVLYAVLQTKEGKRVGDQSFEGEVLAGQGSFLAMVASQLSSVFQAGDMVFTMVEGKSRHLLLFGLKNHLLCVLASGETQAGAVEAQVRQTFTGNR